MFGLFKKKTTIKILFDLPEAEDGPSVSSIPYTTKGFSNNIGVPMTYQIERVNNGYNVNSYVENNQGFSNKSFQKVFMNDGQVIKYLTKQLRELEDQIKIEILKQ